MRQVITLPSLSCCVAAGASGELECAFYRVTHTQAVAFFNDHLCELCK